MAPAVMRRKLGMGQGKKEAVCIVVDLPKRENPTSQLTGVRSTVATHARRPDSLRTGRCDPKCHCHIPGNQYTEPSPRTVVAISPTSGGSEGKRDRS